MCNDDSHSPPCRLHCGDDKLPCREWSKRGPKLWHKNQINKDVKQESFSSKLFDEKYNTRSETESEDVQQSAHKQYFNFGTVQNFQRDSNSSVERHEKSGRYSSNYLQLIWPGIELFREALDYRT